MHIDIMGIRVGDKSEASPRNLGGIVKRVGELGMHQFLARMIVIEEQLMVLTAVCREGKTFFSSFRFYWWPKN